MNRNMILLLLLVMGYLNPTQAADTTAQNAVKQLEDLFDYLYENEMFNGSVGVRMHGEIIFKRGYGWGNADLGTPMTPASQTEIASVSKHFTATAIMMLRNAGKLTLDDNINRFFDPKLPYEGVTIKQLLTHTSGMPDYSKYFEENWKTDDLVYNKDIVQFLLDKKPPLLFEPGSKYKYSNTGFILLAEIINKVSGLPLDRFLKEKVFEPNGMASTGFIDRAKIFSNPNYAFGRVLEKGQYVRPESLEKYRYVGFLSGRLGSGRLSTSVDDMLKWDSLLYTEAVLPQYTLEEMFFPRVETKPHVRYYGYGWYILPPSKLGREIEHSGAWPGNRTFFKRYLSDHSTIILLSNSNSPYISAIADRIDAILKGESYTMPQKK